MTNWRGPKRVPPVRRCVDCGDSCRGWSESSRCAACVRRRRGLGATELEPGGLAEEVRRRRLERQAETS